MPKVAIEITNTRTGVTMRAILKDSIKLNWPREGAPGRLAFTVVKDHSVLDFQNGNPCAFFYGTETKPRFIGYCFSKERDHEPFIDCIAYDQIRYLKYEDTIQYSDKTYGELVSMIVADRALTAGKIVDTGFKLPARTEQCEYYEMLANAATSTTIATGRVFVLYDDAGKLTLKDTEDMAIHDMMLTPEVMETWSYTNTIDNGTYNRIKLHYVDNDDKITDTIVFEDPATISEWGILQYYARTNEPRAEVEKKGKALLKLLNRPVRSLKLKNVIGNINVRGGSIVMVALPLGDMDLISWMLVESAEHDFEGEKHLMSLEVRSADFMPAIDASGVFTVTKETSKISGSGVRDVNIYLSGNGIPEDSNAAVVWNLLRAHGFSQEAAAGLLGNIMQESSFDPMAGYPNGAAVGLFQWGNNMDGSRWQSLLGWANASGKDPFAINVQIEYAIIEMSGMFASVGGLQGFKQLTDVETATVMFEKEFERAGTPMMENRISYAYSHYTQFTSAEAMMEAQLGQGTGVLGYPVPGSSISQHWSGSNYSNGDHIGTDIGAAEWTPIYAADSGIVDWVQYWDGYSRSGNQSYGNGIKINHGNGMETRYAHMVNGGIAVSQGQTVSKGDLIGYVGNTGNSYGAHLHFEVIVDGKIVNPEHYI